MSEVEIKEQATAFNPDVTVNDRERGVLKDGRAYYIPIWSAKVAYENMIQGCNILGKEEFAAMALSGETDVARLVVMGAKDYKLAYAILENFVTSARVDGSKIQAGSVDDFFKGDMKLMMEVFVKVVEVQYASFFG